MTKWLGGGSSQQQTAVKNRNGINMVASHTKREVDHEYFLEDVRGFVPRHKFAGDGASTTDTAGCYCQAATAYWPENYSYTMQSYDGSPCPDMNPFRGLKFGLGVAYSSSLGGVGSVSVDPTTRVVHVTKQNASAARGVFEAHYFWEFCNATNRGGAFIYIPSHYDTSTRKYECWTDNATYKDVSFGMGPFVSLNTSPFDTSGSSSGAKLFDSVGLGWMIGLNAFPTGPSGLHSLNFGVGAIIDTGVKVLSPGVMDGLPTTLPAGTETRLVTKTGFMALLTYKIVDISSPSAAP